MSWLELFFIAVGLSMDAFAVSVCKGLSAGKASHGQCALAGLYFGLFQALMPLAGYLLGARFSSLITSVDHWIAFGLLSVIGGKMIVDSRGGGEKVDASFSPRAMLPLAVATSIDALAMGVGFAFLQVNILPAVLFIGLTTFCLSALGVRLGSGFGGRLRSGAELLGGVILVLMGVKILLEHLGILAL